MNTQITFGADKQLNNGYRIRPSFQMMYSISAPIHAQEIKKTTSRGLEKAFLFGETSLIYSISFREEEWLAAVGFISPLCLITQPYQSQELNFKQETTKSIIHFLCSIL
jgi:hypothetical protein